MAEKRDKLFNEYFSSIFSQSNIFSKREYEDASLLFEINYGKFLPSHKEAKILDIGCGTGHFLYFLEKKGYTNFMGIDISQQQIDFCRENVSKKVETINAFEFLKQKKNIYDVVVANDLLEHIPKGDVPKLLRLINDSLKNEGVFLMRTPNMGSPFAIYSRYKDFTHEVGFTDKSLYQVFWTAGFRDIQILPYRRHAKRSFKRFIEFKIARMIGLILIKLFQIQGYVAPKILAPLLMGVARK